MNELRWILLLAGVALIGGIYLWSRLDRARAERSDAYLDTNERDLLQGIDDGRRPNDSGDVEEALNELGDLMAPEEREAMQLNSLRSLVAEHDQAEGTENAAEVIDSEDTTGQAVDETPPEAMPADAGDTPAGEDAAESPEQQGSDADEMIVVLNVMGVAGGFFTGPALGTALEAADMHLGDMQIYHHYGVGQSQGDRPVFSAANMLEPGTFDPARMARMTTPGITLFMRLPGAMDGALAFELMLNTGQRLAKRLEGELRDESRSTLGLQTISHIREQITEFSRRRAASA